jgi:hypothetical protein
MSNIRKVNLADLAGSLSKKGKPRYQDNELLEAFREMLVDGEPFVWDTAIVEGKTDKEIEASKAKWRNRASSVFATLDSNVKISIVWTMDTNEMVIIPKG